jgi:hypothetical protein
LGKLWSVGIWSPDSKAMPLGHQTLSEQTLEVVTFW